MSTFLDDPAISAAVALIVKASIVLGAAALVQGALRSRASAATRHLIWTLASAGLLLLPLLSMSVPTWLVVIGTAPIAAAPAPNVDRTAEPAARVSAEASPIAAQAPPASQVSWRAVIAAAYFAGLIGMLTHLLLQQWRIRRFASDAPAVEDPVWTSLLAESAGSMGIRRRVRLLRSRERTMPMALGTRRPAIVIPAVADAWADDRRRAVVLHELAHVARYDCLTQTLAVAARAVYWFHPAAWWVVRRLRIERELACDDRVIAAGAEAREYAGHLLEIAYSFGRHRAPALAVSMARPNQLEGRMLAALDAARNRRVPGRRSWFAAAALAAVVVSSIAGATPAVAVAEAENRPVVVPADGEGQHARPADDVRTIVADDVARPVRESARRIVNAAAAAMGFAQDGLPGTWEVRATSTEGVVHLRLVELNSSTGTNVPLGQFEGLTAAQLTGAGGPVQFRLRRDAGTFTFDGVLRNGVGAGTFSFTPDPGFPAELTKRGFARPTASEQYQLARHDVGFAFVDELNRQGYAKPDTSELVRAGQHGVQATYLREMGALGYRLGSLAPLITLRDHGVTPSYVRELADQGYKGLPADELRNARDHGVTPDYVRAMRDAGYGSLPMTALVNARDHGVNAEFVRGLGDAGYRSLPLEQAIRVRDHGVTPEYVREIRQLGYTLAMDDLIRARDHGVIVEYVRAMSALGYASQSMDEMIRLRDHGVTPEYAQELKALGYERVPLADLVSLRDHGLTADRIRAANARAGTRLPIDLLKSLAAGGMR